MTIGALFFVGGLLLLLPAILSGGTTWVLAWPAASYMLVGVGYFGLGPSVLGKGRHGRVSLWSRLVHAPYFLLMRVGWILLRTLAPEPAYNQVAPGLFVGRRCTLDGLPEGIGMVVDMTAELDVPAGLKTAVRYRCLPTLDGDAPPSRGFSALVEEMARDEGPIYVHCAAGHGRSATAAAALLLHRGDVRSVDEAVALMRRARPRVRLVPRQRRSAARFARL